MIDDLAPKAKPPVVGQRRRVLTDGAWFNREGVVGRIDGDTTNDRAEFNFQATSSGSDAYTFTFTYQVI